MDLKVNIKAILHSTRKKFRMDKVAESKFVLFENDKNNCWLNASLVLVAHNRTLRKIADGAPKSQINKIIAVYDAAMCHLNDSDISIELRMKRTQKMLRKIQIDTLYYLQQSLKCKIGEPDSAFCALLNLIKRDKSDVEKYLNANWFWKKICTSCGESSISSYFIKPIITLTKVKNFQPKCPTSIYMCQCKTEQEMQLIYKELPPCLIFHFENGAGDEGNFPLTFIVKEREYLLTGLVILEKCCDPSLNHFVTWIRNPSVNMWLNCNDLNTDIVSFSFEKPECNLKDVYMYVFESFDSLNKIQSEVPVAQDKTNLNVEVIDLSDEADEVKLVLENKSCENGASRLHRNIKNQGTSTTLSEKSRIIDYRNIPISNIRCSFVKRHNASLDAIRYSYDSQACIQSFRSNIIKDTEVELQAKITHDNLLGANINPLEKKIDIKNSYEIHGTRKNIQSNINSMNNLNSDMKHNQSLQEFSFLPKSISMHLTTNNANLRQYKQSPVHTDLEEEQLAKKKFQCSSNFNSKQDKMKLSKKRKYSPRQSFKHCVNDDSEKLHNSFSNISISDSSQPKDKIIHPGDSKLEEKKQHAFSDQSGQKTVYDSCYHSPAKAVITDIAEESEISNYDEKELLLKMHQIPLKKRKYSCTNSSQKKNVLDSNQQTNHTYVSKSDIQKISLRASQCKNSKWETMKREQITNNKDQDFEHRKRVKQSFKLSSERGCYENQIAVNKKALDREIEDVIINIKPCEKALAAVLQFIFLRKC